MEPRGIGGKLLLCASYPDFTGTGRMRTIVHSESCSRPLLFLAAEDNGISRVGYFAGVGNRHGGVLSSHAVKSAAHPHRRGQIHLSDNYSHYALPLLGMASVGTKPVEAFFARIPLDGDGVA